MRKFVFEISVILLSSLMFFGCNKDKDDVRDPFCGIYDGTLTLTQQINGRENSQDNKAELEVRKNGDNIKSISIYNKGSLMFSTVAMNVVNTPQGDSFCGHVYENVANDAEGHAVTTIGVPVSDENDYSCVIGPNSEGKMTLRFSEQQSYTNSGGMEVLQSYTFSGVKN